MKSICIIGQGNVATHLCVAFAGKVEELYSINSRTLEDLPEHCSLYIISVSDSAISEVASRLPRLEGVVAHTSGSVSIDAIDSVKGPKGVFYPLMTFSREDDIDYRKIPLFIEASSAEALATLRCAASLFTDRIVEMDSAQRMRMHVASVFACNFANALWQVAYDMMAEQNVPFRYLLPLIEASVDKLQRLTPAEAQTGPARRGDLAVLAKHRDLLASDPALQRIYDVLSNLIISRSNAPRTTDNVSY